MGRMNDMASDPGGPEMLDWLESLPLADAFRESWALQTMYMAGEDWDAVCRMAPIVQFFELEWTVHKINIDRGYA